MDFIEQDWKQGQQYTAEDLKEYRKEKPPEQEIEHFKPKRKNTNPRWQKYYRQIITDREYPERKEILEYVASLWTTKELLANMSDEERGYIAGIKGKQKSNHYQPIARDFGALRKAHYPDYRRNI